MLWFLVVLVRFAGNYGNKLDENSPAQPSTTPPSNPIYDGNSYYYLPWMEQKPCIQVCVCVCARAIGGSVRSRGKPTTILCSSMTIYAHASSLHR